MLTFSFGEREDLSCALVLGGFDGLHLGHRQILREAKKSALPVLLTTMYGSKGKQLFTLGEREFLFARAGVSAVCEIELSPEVRSLSAEEFLKKLFAATAPRLIVCGRDFRFGKDAAGTPELLRRLSPCPVTVGEIVGSPSEGSGGSGKFSTSSCKELLQRGELALLNACLCPAPENFYDCAYFIGGRVEHGRQVGRTYGFPTLNLSAAEEKLLPPDGVYGGLAATPKGNYPCILNIGARPTFGVSERKLEAYLDGFSGDLYGADVRVYPTEFYRPISKFESANALKDQLALDVRRLRNLHS